MLGMVGQLFGEKAGGSALVHAAHLDVSVKRIRHLRMRHTHVPCEQAVMYKEKVNYKLPGGDKFDAHQDYAAGWWMYGQSNHISALMCIDPANVRNGCLELVRARHKEGLFCPQWSPLSDEVRPPSSRRSAAVCLKVPVHAGVCDHEVGGL